MRRPLVGRTVLVVSGLGFPLTQLAIRRFGQRGALLVEGVAAGLVVRVVLIAMGAPGRLRRGPAILLWLEALAAASAALAGVRLLLDDAARAEAVAARPTAFEAVRRGTIGTLFGLHTWRFRIYLQPDRGRRPAV